MKRNVYITRLAKYLPNEPVSNEEMEDILGFINGSSSKAKPLILRNNQIKTRYYALDKKGNATHSNAELTKKAIENLFDEKFGLKDVDVLSCGTSSPDQILPAHAAMVHGLLGGDRIEINSSTGACSAGVQALKFGFLSILSGDSENAICAGSERFSIWMLAKYFKEEAQKIAQLEQNGIIAFEKDFLRFMLSDGAGAALLQSKPNDDRLSLRIDWVEQRSFANELPTCMYSGSVKKEDGTLVGWSDMEQDEWTLQSVFAVKQDTKLLGEWIIKKGGEFLVDIIKERNFDVTSLTWYLPHLSSQYFGPRIDKEHVALGINIPLSKWFTNLSTVGNVGAGSPYLMLEEIFNSGKLKKGDTLLMMVPESARFNYAYVHMTAV